MAADAVTLNWCEDVLVHVTDQVFALAGTVVAVDTGREVSCTTFGLVDEVVQSVGRLRVNVVSTFVGPKPPLLCSTALAVTLNAVFTLTEAGLETETLWTLISLCVKSGVTRLVVAQLLAVFVSAGFGVGVMAMQFWNPKVWLLGCVQ